MAAALKHLIYRCTVLYNGHTFFGETDGHIYDGEFLQVRVPIYSLPIEIRAIAMKMISDYNPLYSGDVEYMYIQCDKSDVIIGDVEHV